MKKADKNFKPTLVLILESASEMYEPMKLKKLPNGHVEFDAIVQTTDEINRNKNKYGKSVIAEAYANPRLIDLVARRVWFGEGSHPWDKKNFNRCVDILPANITHRLCRIPTIEGNKCITTVHSVEPCGKMMASWLLDEGSRIGFSMRGLTPVTQEVLSPYKHTVVFSPMTILTYDSVFFPSHSNALMMGNEHQGSGVVAAEGAGIVTEEAATSIFMLDAIKDYITEESAAWDFFKNELGIDFKKGSEVRKLDGNNVGITLDDGRTAALRLESSILSEIGKYL